VSTRQQVIHGSGEWMQGKSPQDMLNCGWLLRGNGDPKHWTRLVWKITDQCPVSMLAADTQSNQGAVRKDLGSLTAKGACTHVCMHMDPKTGRLCGHTWHLKPKVTAASKKISAVDASFSVFSAKCTSKKNRDFPGFESRFGRDPGIRGIGNPGLVGIPGFGESGIPIWPGSGK
jgi:hypothetical protein